ILGIAREAYPPEGPDPAREDGAYVLGDEARDLQRVRETACGGLGAQPVPVLEDHGAALAIAEQRRHVRAKRVVDRPLEALVLDVGGAGIFGGVPAWHVASQRVMRGGLVRDDAEVDAVGEKAWKDDRRGPDQRDRGR